MSSIKIDELHRTVALQLYVDWFDADNHPDFIAWADQRLGRGLASWCHSGQSHSDTEYPDIFVGLDPSLNGEGTDSDMPAAYWDALVAKAKAALSSQRRTSSQQPHIVVRLTSAN